MAGVARAGPLTRYLVSVEGIVQGVGFRPFVKRLADRLELHGTVWNSSAGVVIHVGADEALVQQFVSLLQAEAPAAARIERCTVTRLPVMAAYTSFEILESFEELGQFTLTSPDLAVCEECAAEIRDPSSRRYRYAFTNCTNCGPRYSITLRVPYDRANTTMAPFAMCVECAAEYEDPLDRRFHAQPNACPVCGPKLEMNGGSPLTSTVGCLRAGKIVAVKGLGGFQLACDAFSESAVECLRIRKRRSRKPFALMMRDLGTVEQHCVVSTAERELLTGSAAPIVLLRLREPSPFPEALAPGLREVGVMLPYTPLHHLLFAKGLTCLVMTSGNLSEEPIAIDNAEAADKLAPLSDALLAHNRDIFMRVDDSVVRHHDGAVRVLRRARGFAPSAIELGFTAGEVLACGGELKNTFCLTKQRYAILSQHIGDLQNFETLSFFEETLRNLKQVYRAKPRVIAHDLHPDYLSTRWAQSQELPCVAVQHHHAHIASCMVENGCAGPVIGVAFDGTGYGTDGQVWGGEFLVCAGAEFERVGHLRYVPLLGGDRAAREGWRMAAAHLFDAFGPEYRALDLAVLKTVPESTWKVFDQLLSTPRRQTLTSSCGRLFDAIASIAGVAHESSYEGEAAMRLEAAASSQAAREYSFAVDDEGVIDTRPMIRELVADVLRGDDVAPAFHATLASMIETVCVQTRERRGIDSVCLSGGAFQNFTLLGAAAERLQSQGFRLLTHSRVPPNDGGLALGQAVIAALRAQQEKG